MINKKSFHSDTSVNSALNRVKSCLNFSLKDKYGIEDETVTETILKTHGLSRENFEFIRNFETLLESGINNTSLDANANKSEITINGLSTENSIPKDKLIGYRYLYRKMSEMYGKKRAKVLSGEMYDYSLALADSSKILSAYSYYKNTPVLVRINNIIKTMTLGNLFDKYVSYSKYNEEYEMDEIYTENIKVPVLGHKSFVYNNSKVSALNNYNKMEISENIVEVPSIEIWDDENEWVKISRIIKHRNENDFILYQTKNGDFALVTDNHPVIMEDGSEKLAGELKLGDYIKDAEFDIPSNIREYVEVPEKLAYFLGFLTGDGNAYSFDIDKDYINNPVGAVKFTRGGSTFTIYQNDIKNARITKIVKELFPDCKFFKFNKDSDRTITFANYRLAAVLASYFGIYYKENSFTKHLPENFLSWNKGAKEAFIAGLVDSDGAVFKKTGRCDIRLASYATVNVLYDALNQLNAKSVNKRILDPKDTFFCGVAFNPTEGIYNWSEKLWTIDKEIVLKDNSFFNRNHSGKQNVITKIYRIKEEEVNKQSFFYEEIQDVYDITTETGRFIANGMVQHNCFAVNSSKLVLEGRPFGKLHSGVPKRPDSYLAALTETIHQLSNVVAGALAPTTIFIDVASLFLKAELFSLDPSVHIRGDYSLLKNNINVRKQLENRLQSFVHSMNSLSRSATESPFTNVSLFDRPKLDALLAEDNLWFLFEDLLDDLPVDFLKEIEGKNYDKETIKKEFKKYVIEVIIEVQEIFSDIMDAGDVENDGAPITFPVTTVNLSKALDENGEFYITDEKALKDFCKRDIYRYNIYVSEGTKVASCCFIGDQKVIMRNSDGEKIVTLKELNEDIPNNSNTSIFHNGFWKKYSKVSVDYTKPFYKITTKNNKEAICTDNHIFPTLEGDKRADELTEDDMLMFTTKSSAKKTFVYSVKDFEKEKDYRIKEDSVFFGIKSIERVENKDGKAYCVNIKNDEPYFTLANGIITHNCRLINDSELLEMGGQVNSFGGTSISLGSHRVCTVNLKRIAIETKNKLKGTKATKEQALETYLRILETRLDGASDILKAHKELLKDLIEMNTQEFFKLGWLDLDKMFSTFGLLGYYEADKDLKEAFGNLDYLKEILVFIDKKAKEISKEKKMIINIEQIPAESMMQRLAKVDRKMFGEDLVPEKLYANQFVPLFESGHSLWERMEIDGKYGSYLTGGGICHFSLGEKVTPAQAEEIIRFAVKVGSEHFALNPVYSICNGDVSHTTFGKNEMCPICGSPIRDYLTRTIGFFTKVEDWSTLKKEEDFEKRDYTEV